MRIRHPLLVAATGRFAVAAARTLIRTLRVELRCLGAITAPGHAVPPGPRYAYACWHEYLLLPAVHLAHDDLAALISRHADGQILATLLRSMGTEVVHGSTNRGALEAVRKLASGATGRRHLVITPDGPRGPRRVAQPGLTYIASRTGMAVVPIGVGFEKAFRLNSWDQFALPRPGTRARIVCGEPVELPAGLRSAELERATVPVQAAIERATRLAEVWAKTGRFPSSLS